MSRLSLDEDRARRVLHRQGLRDPEIASERHVSQTAIFQWRQRRGLPANGIRGCPLDRFDYADRNDWIRALRKEGKYLKEISDITGLSVVTIGAILRGHQRSDPVSFGESS